MSDRDVPTQRRVVVGGIDDIRVETEPRPAPGAGDVLVRTSVVGICGSDTHACLGTHPFIDLPYRPGHEVVGVVERVGAGVRRVAAGDRVVVEPNLVCGQCVQCRSGRYNICAELAVFGCQTPGGLAETFVIADDRLHRIPAGLSDLDAALAEPLATPVRAVRAAGDLTHARVAILGGGPIGLLVMIAARHAGAPTIALTDPNASKRERAVRLGADAAVDASGPDVVADVRAALCGPADVVFDCVSREVSMALSIELATKGGQVVVVGVGTAGTTPVRLDLIQDREIVVRGSLMYVGEDFRTSLALLAAGTAHADDLVTSVFEGLDEAADAFRASIDSEQCKIMVRLGR